MSRIEQLAEVPYDPVFEMSYAIDHIPLFNEEMAAIIIKKVASKLSHAHGREEVLEMLDNLSDFLDGL